MRFVASIAAVMLALLAFVPRAAFAEPAASADDTARILAGMPPSQGSPLASIAANGFWKQHARTFDEAWTSLERRQLSKIRSLVANNFTDPQRVLFYMFSGPDFLYADAFFPSADTYVMSGLEPPGQLPDLRKLSPRELASALRELRSSLNSVLSYSFFRTKAMRVELNEGRMTGTLPILMVFLARSGKTIYDVSFFDLQSDGSIHPAEDKVPNATAKGVKIVFSDNVGKKRTLYYFSTDVSNGGIKTSGFLQFCTNLGTGDSFVKSASYLMHSDNFSTVREFLLAHSASLLQDDSGIPIRFLAQGWQLHPFGRYVGPIPLFAGQSQSALYRVFGKSRTQPLDFSLGYRWRPTESNLLLAVKDASASATDVITPTARETEQTKPRREAEMEARDGKRARRSHHHNKERTVSNPNSKVFPYLP
jgi:hypothetical protein